MKSSKSIIFFLFLAAFGVFAVSCKKQVDNEKTKKEAEILKLTEEISVDSLESYVSWMQGLITRFALSDSHRSVAVNIKNKFMAMGYSNTKIDSFWINTTYKNVNYQQWQYNVIATLEGSSGSDSISVMGAHYDDILNTGDPFATVPGANDNASGVAAALEVARVMKKDNYVPKYTIRFIAFGSEELGLYGSSAYASYARTNLQNIRFMLNNDMIAYETDSVQANWSVNIIDYDNSHYIRTEAEQLCSRYTVLQSYNDNTYKAASDSYPFFKNGYKALFFFSDKMDPNYHTPFDYVENCNFRYSREIIKISCAFLADHN